MVGNLYITSQTAAIRDLGSIQQNMVMISKLHYPKMATIIIAIDFSSLRFLHIIHTLFCANEQIRR